MKELRRLICEEIAKSIPFEHDIQLYKNTDWKSNFFLGKKPYTGKDFDYPNRKPELKPVDNTPSPEYYERIERGNRTENEKRSVKDLSRILKSATESSVKGAVRTEEEEFIPSRVWSAPRLDIIMCGAVLLEFNVNKIFRDVHDNYVFHISLENKLDERANEYVPGGAGSREMLQGIADKNEIEIEELKKQLKKGMQLEMRHTKDELVALEVAMSRIMKEPMYYRNMAVHGENNMGISAYTRPNAKESELKMMSILENLNKVFGTMYYIDISYPKQSEDIFVIKSGKIDENSDKPLSYGQFLDFDKVRAEQEAILRVHEAMHGLSSIMNDNTPWREITEPLNEKPVRAAVVGSSAYNA